METCTIHHKDTGVFLANEKKTKIVTLITLITMIVEIIVGYWSGSMALLADGWHMASHTLAIQRVFHFWWREDFISRRLHEFITTYIYCRIHDL